MVEPLSASGSAANTASMAPGPTSFSRSTAFLVAGSVGSFEERISVTSLSARRFVKKLIEPFHAGGRRDWNVRYTKPADYAIGIMRASAWPGQPLQCHPVFITP